MHCLLLMLLLRRGKESPGTVSPQYIKPTAPGSACSRSLTAHLVLSPPNYPLHGNYDTYHAYLSNSMRLIATTISASTPFNTKNSLTTMDMELLAAIDWLIIGIARIISSWGRELSRPGSGIWHQFESTGFILASVIGILIVHRALGITPHTQWRAVIDPLLLQTAWASMTYNITLDGAARTATR
ncbi:uncharacterized protein EDB91DRAFT_1087820 [Suillus paluster]|uniref:uncharacterized protein n=1 Tax=Suillus paluster TaxID=48578 RepID=UPI001B87CB08|nr:uncharacterized protein EDB91DRAFT_1087820 [Suillus paluster]KAG1723423.1 hypothetical protein EDB91DRAFT_1087820 [Suillus paluster]